LKIDYSDLKSLIEGLPHLIGKQGEYAKRFVKQVMKDGGEIFFGLVDPDDIEIKITVRHKYPDEDDKNEKNEG